MKLSSHKYASKVQIHLLADLHVNHMLPTDLLYVYQLLRTPGWLSGQGMKASKTALSQVSAADTLLLRQKCGLTEMHAV
jgi:hypothetical protein